mmetsp:Transcript_11895/g.22206  ORF Transcript_11895/g.22206 Transcript_11895/m.22206 type:complete len:333 (-) Transcript_11895:217-1215(-)
MSITKKTSSSSAEVDSSNSAANATSAAAAAAPPTANSSDHSDIAIYGQQPPKEETPEFLSSSFAELDRELDNLPEEKKAGWLKAKEKCPELVGEGHRLMFLRCEVFRADDAAIRITKYWNKRIELFGENLAFKPLTMEANGALPKNYANDSSLSNEDKTIIETTFNGMSHAFIRPTNTFDSAGRALIFVDPSRLSKYKHVEEERRGVIRSTWYFFHSMLENNESAQKLGIVVIGYPHHVKLSYVDRKLLKMNLESMTGCIPVRLGALHICHPPWFFSKIVFPIMKIVMNERMRKRVRLHNGSKEDVLGELEGFGLSKRVLPVDIGGEVVVES